ncbi:MAG: hypothetical protein QOF76_2222 [Solirubrobacteraceae bacterium]|jgi:hypothetical protein|nr:hypothetical protein [Solirubrobacteraceae bacterium]
MSGHWLDRLALRTTRRDALRTAAAGAIVFSLPGLLRPARAAADGCTKGCRFAAGRAFRSRRAGCIALTNSAASKLIAAVNWPGLALATVPEAYTDLAAAYACNDLNVLRYKAAASDCATPGCGVFDPYAPGGPCEGCGQAGVFCCECPTTDEGYMCCVFACSDKDHSCCPT